MTRARAAPAVAAALALLAAACGDEAPPPGSRSRVEAILEAGLASPVPQVRAAAIHLIGLAGAADRLPALEAAAEDGPPLVQLAVLGARARLAPHAAAAEAERRFLAGDRAERDRLLALAAALRTGPVAAAVRRAAVRGADREDRRTAIRLAGDLPPAEARRLLRPLLDDPDPALRRAAAIRLYAAGFADGLPGLLHDLFVGPPERRAAAAGALGQVGERTAIAALLRAAGDPEGIVGPMAAIALCRLGHDPACGRVLGLVHGRASALLRPALAALAAAGDAAARAALAEAVGHAEADVRRAAAEALLGADDPAVRALAEPLLADPEPGPRAAAAAALIRDDHAGARGAVAEALARGELSVRRHVIEALAAAYRDAPAPALAEALGEAWSPDGEPGRVQGDRSEEVAVRATALRALLEAGPPEARREAAARALRHPDPELRYLAARAVAAGEAPDPGAPLDAATTDAVLAVRLAAAAARLRHPSPEVRAAR